MDRIRTLREASYLVVRGLYPIPARIKADSLRYHSGEEEDSKVRGRSFHSRDAPDCIVFCSSYESSDIHKDDSTQNKQARISVAQFIFGLYSPITQSVSLKTRFQHLTISNLSTVERVDSKVHNTRQQPFGSLSSPTRWNTGSRFGGFDICLFGKKSVGSEGDVGSVGERRTG